MSAASREELLSEECRNIKRRLDGLMPARLSVSASIQVEWEWKARPDGKPSDATNADAQLVVRCEGAYFVEDPSRAIAIQGDALDLIDALAVNPFYLASWQAMESLAVSEERVPDSSVLSSEDFAARMRGKRGVRGA